MTKTRSPGGLRHTLSPMRRPQGRLGNVVASTHRRAFKGKFISLAPTSSVPQMSSNSEEGEEDVQYNAESIMKRERRQIYESLARASTRDPTWAASASTFAMALLGPLRTVSLSRLFREEKRARRSPSMKPALELTRWSVRSILQLQSREENGGSATCTVRE